MGKFLGFVDGLSKWAGTVFAYSLWPGVAILVYEVIARYFFNAPTVWAHGMTQRIFAIYYFVCGSYITLTNSHINMDILYNRYSPRGKAILDIISFVFFFSFAGVLIWYGTKYSWTSLKNLEPCNTPFRAPIYPVKMIIPIGAFLILLQEIAKLMRNIYFVVHGERYEP